jgi:hypothetical protein
VLFEQRFWPGIADGSITLAFRRWKRPTVRSGERLRSPTGELAIESVDVINETTISDNEAHRAGYESRDALLMELNAREGTLYRIAFHLAGPDSRIALRDRTDLTEEDFSAVRSRLERMDRGGPWTLRMLRLIAECPATRAADLAATMGSETLPFKERVRKLKELGLTESLEVGYRLSARGRAVLQRLQKSASASDTHETLEASHADKETRSRV